MKSTPFASQPKGAQVGNWHYAKIRDKRTNNNITKDTVGDSTPQLKLMLVNAPEQPAKNTDNLETATLYIKNMVTIRCKMIVKAVLEFLGIIYSVVDLGVATIVGKLSDKKNMELKSYLSRFDLELVEDKNMILVEKIIKVIVEMIHHSDELPNVKFSNYLSEKVNCSYAYLAKLFSEVNGTSIQHFIMLHKIERVKELLVYDELTVSEIAWKLNYSSVAHLSNHFKKITGLTPTYFKNLQNLRRVTLDNL